MCICLEVIHALECKYSGGPYDSFLLPWSWVTGSFEISDMPARSFAPAACSLNTKPSSQPLELFFFMWFNANTFFIAHNGIYLFALSTGYCRLLILTCVKWMEVESHQFASQNIVCDTRPVNIFSIPILQSQAAGFIGPTLQTGDRMFGLWWKAETGDPYSSSALCRVQWCAWQEGCKGSNKLPCMCRACYWASHTQTPNSTFIPRPPHYTHHTHFTFLCFALKKGGGEVPLIYYPDEWWIINYVPKL